LVELIPEWLGDTDGLTPNEQATERGRVRAGLLTFLAGSIAVVGAVYTARTFALNRRGQVTERFTRAVDQLGSDNPDVRLGGIYALDRLARESVDDHGPIMEILMAFVRTRSPWPPTPDGRRKPDKAKRPEDPPPAPVDVRAALNVLRRRRVSQDAHQLIDFDLAATNLCGIDTDRLCLPRARLSGTQLRDATLLRADLREATLIAANLEGAVLVDARLNGVQLRGASLRGASVQGCDFNSAKLDKTDLTGARYDGRTRWPAGFDPEAAGAVSTPG
jgi:hypothetical protein